MKKNMGTADRIIRLVIAAVIAALLFTDVINGAVALILIILAGVYILTSLIGFCPLYALVGVSTCHAKE